MRRVKMNRYLVAFSTNRIINNGFDSMLFQFGEVIAETVCAPSVIDAMKEVYDKYRDNKGFRDILSATLLEENIRQQDDEKETEVADDMCKECPPTHAHKPPLGIESQEIWKVKRMFDLADTIKRYAEDTISGHPIAIKEEWVKEYNDLCEECACQ